MELPALFHLSFNKKLPLTLSPRLPDGSELSNVKTDMSETDVPRVSFAPSIFQCVQAIYPNTAKLFESERGQKEGCEFAVYRYDSRSDARVVTPDELIKRHWVWDAHITEEHCFLDPVQVYYCGSILVFVDNDVPNITVRPYNDNSTGRTQTLIGDARIRQTHLVRGDKYKLKFFGGADYARYVVKK